MSQFLLSSPLSGFLPFLLFSLPCHFLLLVLAFCFACPLFLLRQDLLLLPESHYIFLFPPPFLFLLSPRCLLRCLLVFLYPSLQCLHCFHTCGQLDTNIMPVEPARNAPQSSFARERTTTDRQHRRSRPTCENAHSPLSLERLWWQKAIANDQ